MSDLLMDTGAVFSDCRTWRYRLWRTWDTSKPMLVMIMLNPSTADEDDNDPTVERCQRRAVLTGHGGLWVFNIFALCATDPDVMKAAIDPVGPDNDDRLRSAFSLASIARQAGTPVPTFCAGWGMHGSHRGRDRQVQALAAERGVQLVCLGVTKDGQPRHPLYRGYAVPFQPWSAP